MPTQEKKKRLKILGNIRKTSKLKWGETQVLRLPSKYNTPATVAKYLEEAPVELFRPCLI